MTLSARNQLPGTIKSVVLGSVMAEVVVDVGRPRGGRGGDAALGESLAVGRRQVKVVIKATEVMIDK